MGTAQEIMACYEAGKIIGRHGVYWATNGHVAVKLKSGEIKRLDRATAANMMATCNALPAADYHNMTPQVSAAHLCLVREWQELQDKDDRYKPFDIEQIAEDKGEPDERREWAENVARTLKSILLGRFVTRDMAELVGGFFAESAPFTKFISKMEVLGAWPPKEGTDGQHSTRPPVGNPTRLRSRGQAVRRPTRVAADD
ncbi:MAG: hypothetical protein IPL28_25565 [Chloroflexi bacterium]|nr:hypothetical protein [Chloroflexota bacterium]